MNTISYLRKDIKVYKSVYLAEVSIFFDNCNMLENYLNVRCLCVLFFMTALGAYGQKTIQTNSFEEEYNVAMDLYEKEMYSLAYKKFVGLYDYVGTKNVHVDRISDIEFYLAVSKFRQNAEVGATELIRYIETNPESHNGNLAHFIIGEYYLDNERYSEAVECLEMVSTTYMDKTEEDKYYYMLAYSYFNDEQYTKSANIFAKLKDKASIYQRPSSYYWGYINYYDGKYEAALKEFDKLENEKGFDKVIPYYIAQIYFKQEKYNQAISKSKSLFSSSDNLQKLELQKILGVSYFKTKNYESALQNLNNFEQNGGQMGDGENYAKAFCLYVEGHYSAAIPYFEKATNSSSGIVQNAYFHLANCYLKENNKEAALMAFGKASKMNYDSDIREEALFNVAKLSWDTGYSPFNENIKALQSYINDYPNGTYKDEATEYLTQAFMSANNYDQALSVINSMGTKSEAIKTIAQQIYYNKGVDFFNDHKYVEAIKNFNEAIMQGAYKKPYRALSRYWKAEAYYHMRDYKEAYRAIKQFRDTDGASTSKVYGLSHYTEGYLTFNLERYTDAISAFSTYINSNETDLAKKCDSYNRIGDAYYQTKSYKEAFENFKESLRVGKHEPDYANYMMAVCYGRLGNERAKQDELIKFKDVYPKSAYVDDAIYELGLSFERLKNYAGATAYFNIILNHYEESEYYRKVILKLGLYYFRDGDYNLAAKYYEQVVREFPNSEEAKEAMQGLKRAYTYNQTVDRYVAFSESVYGTRVSANEQDSLNFESAERLFLDKSKGAMKALEAYLNKFSNGAFVLDANYYLGEILFDQRKYELAYEHYKIVAAFSANEYTESALMKCAELSYSLGKYKDAEGYYDQVLLVPSTKWVKLTAQMGAMNNYLKLAEYDKVINMSDKALTSDIINQKQKEDIDAVLGVCYYRKGDYGKAMNYFEILANKPRTEIGARAKYTISEIKYNDKDYDGAESNLLEMISSGTSQQYWLGKSFILLSDVYMKKGETFQAKQTLQSLIDNYTDNTDGIADEARKKLQNIKTTSDTVTNKQPLMEINLSE
ncbi:MAG: tetratricopeptide repeat protein [Bacteroidales bacterium]